MSDYNPESDMARVAEARGRRIALLETHLRRVLEAGMKLRWSDATDPWDQAASDAEGVLAPKQSPTAAEHR